MTLDLDVNQNLMEKSLYKLNPLALLPITRKKEMLQLTHLSVINRFWHQFTLYNDLKAYLFYLLAQQACSTF